MLFNEFDTSTKFYKMLKVEAQIRHFAQIYPNSYMLTILSTCRQLYIAERMTDCQDLDSVSELDTEPLKESKRSLSKASSLASD